MKEEPSQLRHEHAWQCGGLCRLLSNRVIALTVAMDRVTDVNDVTTFRDIDEKNGLWRRVPIKGGRGILVIKGTKRLVVTDHCMAVCCKRML